MGSFWGSLIFRYDTSRATAAAGVVVFGEKETINRPNNNDTHGNADDDDDK